MKIRLATSEEQIRDCHPVMAELRPHVAEDTFEARIRRQVESHHYHLVSVTDEGKVRAVAGFRISECLAWGNFLYVDDLVTADSERSKGYGEALLGWLIDYAKHHDCDELHLDSGVQRFAAHRFYLRQRMDITSHHFVTRLGD